MSFFLTVQTDRFTNEASEVSEFFLIIEISEIV